MKISTKKINETLHYPLELDYSLNDILLFDIETTNFSPLNSMLYLIGCIYYKNSSFYIIQFFAENILDEPLILTEFTKLITNYKLLINYNGNGFDIPYIKSKCTSFNISNPFNNIESFDIYKKILPLKHFLNLENLKQKTVEEFLNIKRNDKYSARKLINLYKNYLKSPSSISLFLLHNEEDLINMMLIINTVNYLDIFNGSLPLTHTSLENDMLCLTFNIKNSLIKSINYSDSKFNLSLDASNNICTLLIPLYNGELKFFYPNYKDYYYLKEEDMAIHKSVATYVDKDFRIKATASNCYLKKNSIFVPQFEEVCSQNFKINYNDKISYIEITDNFLNDNVSLSLYGNHILKHILQH